MPPRAKQSRRKALPQPAAQPMSKRRKLLAGALIVAGAGVGAWLTWGPELRAAYPIRYVRVQGTLLGLDEEELRNAVAPFVNAGYFDVDLAAIERAARSLAWVDAVRVVRLWPDSVMIQLTEHHPIARWNDGGLLSDRGVAFTPPRAPTGYDLPRLVGADGQQKRMLEVWNRLNAMLAARKLKVVSLEMNPRESWIARLSDGKELVIGRQEPVVAVERLLKFLPNFGASQIADIKRVDLRYRNGFAVVWGLEREAGPSLPKPDEAKPTALDAVPKFTEQLAKVATNQW